MQGLSRSIGP
ncbi:unnamed protein product, partial [Didymodactylos carnosus]